MIEYRIRLERWFTHKDENKFPVRIWHGWVEYESAKALHVNLWVQPGQDGECLRCGRTLTHPISKYVGLGPECGKHYYKGYNLETSTHMNEWNDLLEFIKKGYDGVTYNGWIPRKSVQSMVVVGEDNQNPKWRVKYTWKGKSYQSIADHSGLQRLLKYAIVKNIEVVEGRVRGV